MENSVRASALVLVFVGACDRRPASAPRPERAPRPAVVAVDVPVVVDVSAVADVTDDVADDPDAALIRGLADGSIALAGHLDPARGIVMVRYLASPPHGHVPPLRTVFRVCAADGRRAPEVLARLRDAVGQGEPECRGDECVVPAMPYVSTYRMRLGRRADGARVLIAASEVSETAAPAGWAERGAAFIEENVVASAAEHCPRAPSGAATLDAGPPHRR